jgi:hypothetical protein
MKEFFFISGLPRSGSTLLSAILRQNPEFNAYYDVVEPPTVFDTSRGWASKTSLLKTYSVG